MFGTNERPNEFYQQILLSIFCLLQFLQSLFEGYDYLHDPSFDLNRGSFKY